MLPGEKKVAEKPALVDWERLERTEGPVDLVTLVKSLLFRGIRQKLSLNWMRKATVQRHKEHK